MITEDYVSFETAKLLREKGFNGLCTAYYDCFTTDNFHCGYEPTDFNSIDTKIRDIVVAPTLQMAMKWLREKYSIFFNVNYFQLDVGNEWLHLTINLPYKNGCETSFEGFDLEEVYENAIRYSLENLI